MALFYGEASPLWDHLIIPHSPQKKPFRNERLFFIVFGFELEGLAGVRTLSSRIIAKGVGRYSRISLQKSVGYKSFVSRTYQ